jgi:anti-sigma factor RsiW
MAAACGRVRAQLEALVDGQLGEGPASEVRAHLAGCAGCRAHHAEASSLPSRLAAMRAPAPPPALVGEVLRRVRGEQVGVLRLWGPLAVELALCAVGLWYLSGLSGLSFLAEHTVADVAALIGWGTGEADLPPPAAADVFLLVVCALLVATTLYHLSLLSRLGRRPA